LRRNIEEEKAKEKSTTPEEHPQPTKVWKKKEIPSTKSSTLEEATSGSPLGSTEEPST